MLLSPCGRRTKNYEIRSHSLKKEFSSRIKLCYIDVPFNTSSDSFAYNDRFNHSTWLTFMKNRLEVTKTLMKKDGLIFVHCDKNEDAYLKVLMDEIFDRENYITSISVKSNSISGNKTRFKNKTILKNKDTILVYKGDGEVTINPQYTEKTKWDTHYNAFLEVVDEGKNIYKPRRLKDVLIENSIIDSATTITEDFINNKLFMEFCIKHKSQIYRLVNSIPADIKSKSLESENKVIKYSDTDGNIQYALNGSRIAFLSGAVQEIDGYEKLAQLLGDMWSDIDFQNTQNEGGKGVSFPTGKKPEKLLQRIIDMATKKGDIVLDFFMGSATTQAVAMKLDRQFIGIEQMDYIEDISVKRLNNVINGEKGGISKAVNWDGGRDFIYCELAKWNESAKEKIIKCDNYNELVSLFSKLCEKYFLHYNIKVKEFQEKIIKKDEFINLTLDEQKKMFIQMLDLNQMYIHRTEMEDSKYGIDERDQELTKLFYEGD
ncbi:site-specific DNA-methyltransferase [Lentibacillus sp. CBA3610]|uniref:site-specific DNA-methyltransferase n=1 Tax=Lentibacillus sp. CBA3610 TaxID=2518176 RepID=UPI001595B0D1|nr:site-specific DNA-methyltransferase [Lentibacillus sp. CBA3610]